MCSPRADARWLAERVCGIDLPPGTPAPQVRHRITAEGRHSPRTARGMAASRSEGWTVTARNPAGPSQTPKRTSMHASPGIEDKEGDCRSRPHSRWQVRSTSISTGLAEIGSARSVRCDAIGVVSRGATYWEWHARWLTAPRCCSFLQSTTHRAAAYGVLILS